MLRLCVVAGRRRLELDQRQAFERVHRDIQRLSSVAGATATAGQREQTQRIGVGRAAVHRRPQLRRAGFAGDDADGLAEQVLRRQAQQVRAVLARLQDHQVAGPQHQQRAMRLNATGRLHRLGIAIGQRDAVPLDTVGPARPGQRRGRRGRQGHRCPFKVRTALSPACPPAQRIEVGPAQRPFTPAASMNRFSCTRFAVLSARADRPCSAGVGLSVSDFSVAPACSRTRPVPCRPSSQAPSTTWSNRSRPRGWRRRQRTPPVPCRTLRGRLADFPLPAGRQQDRHRTILRPCGPCGPCGPC